MFNEMKLLATFRGAKELNRFRDEVRLYSSPLISTGRFAYDLIDEKLIFIPISTVYNYIFNNLFDKRKLHVYSRELENALARIPHYRRDFFEVLHHRKVCLLKQAVDNTDVLSTLDKSFYKFINWRDPHDCYDLTNNITNHKSVLIVNLPEVNSTVMVNPKYFDVKICE